MEKIFTDEQEAQISEGECPDCGGQLLKGPRGGGAINVLCAKCGHEFWVGRPFPTQRLPIFPEELNKLYAWFHKERPYPVPKEPE